MSNQQVILLGGVGLLASFLGYRGDLPRWGRTAAWAVLVGVSAAILFAGRGAPIRDQLANGLFLGSIYALIALGYTMVYGVLKMINFAHGEVFMVGAYVGGFAVMAYRRQPWLALSLAVPVAMASSALLGVIIERAAYRPLRTAPRLAALITAIGVSLLLQNLVLLLVGPAPKAIPTVLPTTTIAWVEEATGLSVSYPQLVALCGAVLLMLGLQLIVARTATGRAMRAVSEDRDAACLMGIPVDRTIAVTFIIGSALAGAGGVLYTILYTSITPYMGVLPGLKAFVAAVLGGIGSVPGAMVGGMLIGVIEALVASVTASREQVAQAVLFVLLLVLAWRGVQGRLHLLPHDPRWRAVQALASLLALWLGWHLAAVVVGWLSPLLPQPAAGETAQPLTGSTFKDAVVYGVLVVILIVKPTGLMGRFAPEKV